MTAPTTVKPAVQAKPADASDASAAMASRAETGLAVDAAGNSETVTWQIPAEVPVAIQINSEPYTVMMAPPELWPTIQRALDDSRFFVLLASPEAAESHWVGQEVGHFLSTRGPGNLLIALTAGDCAWDGGAGDFDRARSTAIPETLFGRFREEPLYIDLRWARAEAHLDLGADGYEPDVRRERLGHERVALVAAVVTDALAEQTGRDADENLFAHVPPPSRAPPRPLLPTRRYARGPRRD